MWPLPTEMVSAVHSSLCFTKCLIPALPDLLAVPKEIERSRSGSICLGTSAFQPKLWASWPLVNGQPEHISKGQKDDLLPPSGAKGCLGEKAGETSDFLSLLVGLLDTSPLVGSRL